jgi:hypothetical protein
VNRDIANAETPMEGLTTVTRRQVIWIRFQPVGSTSLRWSSSQIGYQSFEEQAPLVFFILKSRTSNSR